MTRVEAAVELRPGIAGFQNKDDPPLPVCDPANFRTHCHAAARTVGGRIVRSGRRPDGLEANFLMAVLELSDGPVAVLLNCHFPVVGFALPPSVGDIGPLRFVDCDGLADALKASGEYEVSSRAELERAVNREDLYQLLPAEIEQAEYWRPASVGDVVFNFWD
jgi:hypothetical protein